MMNTATQSIGRSFSQAAASYDQAASLQFEVGHELLGLIPSGLKVSRWLDLGCGTGSFCVELASKYPQADGVALDLAPGMLDAARQRQPQLAFVCADAGKLPLMPGSLDLIYSNFALQWCSDFPRVLQQAFLMLKPGGVLAFTSVLDGSLAELKHSWQQVDSHQHVNEFRTFGQYQQACSDSGFARVHLLQQGRQCYWPEVRDVLLNLKQTGATHPRHGRAAGLLSSQRFR